MTEDLPLITRTTRLGAFLLVAAAVAACGAGGGSSATPTGAPTGGSTAAPTSEALLIKRAAVDGLACMDALMTGTLSRNGQTGLGVTGPDGKQTAVEWPFGYSAHIEGGVAVLVDNTGKSVAREGDQIQMGGGFGNALWHACGPVTVQGS